MIKDKEGAAPYFAHGANGVGRRHALAEHLSSVARLAREFAGPAAWADEVWLAGLLHDLGKYGDLFQARLRGEAAGLDHWSQGAWLAATTFQSLAAALAIQGHHVGLQSIQAIRQADPAKLARRHPLGLRLSEDTTERLVSRLTVDGLAGAKPSGRVIETRPKGRVDEMLEVRRLFSALMDADMP